MHKVRLLFIFVLFSLPVVADSGAGITLMLLESSFRGPDWHSFSESSGMQNRLSPGIRAGAFLDIPLRRRFLLHPEIAWSLRTLEYGNGDEWIREYRQALELGAFIKRRLNARGRSFYWMTGPELILLTDDALQEGSSGQVSSYPPYSTVYLDLTAGIGVQTLSGLMFGFRYAFEVIPYSDLTLTFIDTIGIELGYLF